MTSDLLSGLLRLNLVAGAAILLVLVIRAPLRRVFGAGAAYQLWALAPLLALASLVPVPQPLAGLAAPIVIAALPSGQSIADGAASPILFAVAAAWALGALAWAGALAFRQNRFMVALGALTPVEVVGRRVWRAGRADVGPAVVGRVIVVPADFETRFTHDEQAAILAHEQVHLSRGDITMNGLAGLAQCLCWFNPLVHLAAGQARIDQELACDAVVIAARPGLRRSYAEALLKTQLVANFPPLGCAWPSRSQHPLKERISMLKLAPLSRRRRTVGAVLLAGLFLGGAYTAWAAQPPARLITRPDWAVRPTGEDMARFYPPAAEKRNLEGSAVIQCRVGLDGALSTCKVLRQSPAAAGFGQASVKLATIFRMKPKSEDGRPVAGGLVRIPIKFRIAGQAAPAAKAPRS